MKSNNFPLCLLSLFVAVGNLGLAQGSAIEFPAPSPPATVQQRIGFTDFEVTYSRPGVKGRKIFGGLQSFGEVWRTGANAATKLTFDTPIRFGGQPVEPGTYALFTIPGEEVWTVMLNRVADQWGAFRYDPAQDVVSIQVPSERDRGFQETFSITFADIRTESATLCLAWENTVVHVPLAVDVRDRLVRVIEATIVSGQPQSGSFYFQAATFYFANEMDLDKAARWIELGLEQEPGAFWMLHLKARIHARLGNVEIARDAAMASTARAVAQEGPGSGYKAMNDALLAELRPDRSF